MLSKLRLSTPKEGFIKITRDVKVLLPKAALRRAYALFSARTPRRASP